MGLPIYNLDRGLPLSSRDSIASCVIQKHGSYPADTYTAF